MDIQYMDGLIERKTNDGIRQFTLGQVKTCTGSH